MKKFLLATAMLLLGMIGNANAVPVTWTDAIDFTPDITIPPTYSYFHNIADGPDGFSSFWTGGNDTISSFSLELEIYDDNLGFETREKRFVGWNWIVPVYKWVTVQNPDGSESGKVSFILGSQDLTFGSGTNTVSGNFAGTLDIFHDGTLNVWVSSTNGGDFNLGSSRLVVSGDNGSAPVPEPATVLLMGLGLVGLVGYNRKRFSKKS